MQNSTQDRVNTSYHAPPLPLPTYRVTWAAKEEAASLLRQSITLFVSLFSFCAALLVVPLLPHGHECGEDVAHAWSCGVAVGICRRVFALFLPLFILFGRCGGGIAFAGLRWSIVLAMGRDWLRVGFNLRLVEGICESVVCQRQQRHWSQSVANEEIVQLKEERNKVNIHESRARQIEVRMTFIELQ